MHSCRMHTRTLTIHQVPTDSCVPDEHRQKASRTIHWRADPRSTRYKVKTSHRDSALRRHLQAHRSPAQQAATASGKQRPLYRVQGQKLNTEATDSEWNPRPRGIVCKGCIMSENLHNRICPGSMRYRKSGARFGVLRPFPDAVSLGSPCNEQQTPGEQHEFIEAVPLHKQALSMLKEVQSLKDLHIPPQRSSGEGEGTTRRRPGDNVRTSPADSPETSKRDLRLQEYGRFRKRPTKRSLLKQVLLQQSDRRSTHFYLFQGPDFEV